MRKLVSCLLIESVIEIVSSNQPAQTQTGTWLLAALWLRVRW